jgi:hypothetical protein
MIHRGNELGATQWEPTSHDHPPSLATEDMRYCMYKTERDIMARSNRSSIEHIDLLTAAERSVVLMTTVESLRGMSEDELLDLLHKVRGMRNKYSKLHRRQAAEKVVDAGGRGQAAGSNQRTLVKAEVFEKALGRVSTQVARVAREEAARLKAERLEAVRAVRSGSRRSGSRRESTSKKGAAESGEGRVGEGAKNVRVKRGPSPQQKNMGAVSRSNQRRAQARKQSRNG